MADQSRQDDDGREARAMSASASRLAEEFSVEPELARSLLDASLDRMSGAAVQQYRLVLAERDVRSQLRRRRSQPDAPPTSDPISGSPKDRAQR